MSDSMNADPVPATDLGGHEPGAPHTPASDSADSGQPAARVRSYIPALAIVAILSLLIDQVTKYLAVTRLDLGERIPVIGDLLGWRLVYNPGAALSLGTGVTWIFTVVMVVVSVAVMVVAKRIGSMPWAIALGALLGGALGNLTDRLVREPGFGVGHVVDFIDYGVFIGNVADIAIVGAAIAIVALSLFGQSWDGKPEEKSGTSVENNLDGEEPTSEPEGKEPSEPDDEKPASDIEASATKNVTSNE